MSIVHLYRFIQFFLDTALSDLYNISINTEGGTDHEKIINFKDFNTGYNAVSEREDNIIGKKIADFRAANKMSLTDLRILLEIYGISITNASISKWETGASVPNIYQFIAVMQALGIDENISFCRTAEPRRIAKAARVS